MTQLTTTNYYDKGNRALTNSKIKNYLISPDYFYRHDITCEIVDDPKDAFTFGAIVDKLLSGEDFDKTYQVADGVRTKKLKEEAEANGITLLTPLQYTEIFEVADAVEKTDAFKYIKKNATCQDILQIPFIINEFFDCLAGRPDFYWRGENGVCYIVDLKTAQTVDHKKYFFQAMGFKYDQQLAMYRLLLRLIYPEIKSFRCFNLVVSKQKNVYGVELFEYPVSIIENATCGLLETIDAISKDIAYTKYNPSFDQPAVFGQFEGGISDPGEWDDEK
jgi:hypothetical protein